MDAILVFEQTNYFLGRIDFFKVIFIHRNAKGIVDLVHNHQAVKGIYGQVFAHIAIRSYLSIAADIVADDGYYFIEVIHIRLL